MNDDTPSEKAPSDNAIARMFAVTKTTLTRWRGKHDFPRADFFVGHRGFTWETTIRKWTERQSSRSSVANQKPPARKWYHIRIVKTGRNIDRRVANEN
jgi:hypothetical protein